MKKYVIVFFFLISGLLNGQTINFKDFDNETLDNVIFNELKSYGDYTHDIYLFDRNRIYEYIKRHRKKISIDEIAENINNKILSKFDKKESISIVGIIDTVQCKNLRTYQEIASVSNSHWNNPSDAFFIQAWGNIIMPVNYYDKKTGICYIFVCFN